MSDRLIYLDNNATTPLDPRVVEAMAPFWQDQYGNAASRTHVFGYLTREAVEVARAEIAAGIGSPDPQTITFLSGSTESVNLALKGYARANRGRRNRIVTLCTEHKAVLDSCARLASEGFDVVYLPVASDGLVDLDLLRASLTDRTLLVSVMAANNEIGVIQDLAAIGTLCRERGCRLHTDATQAVGKIPFDVRTLPVDLVSFNAHKIYGPKGVGALYLRRDGPPIALEPLIDGGGHELGLRSGTLNVPGIVGFARALQLSVAALGVEPVAIAELRDRLENGLLESIDDVHVNGSRLRRLPGTLNVSFGGVDGSALIKGMPNLAVSSTAACSSAAAEPSHVLAALGVVEPLAGATLRFGIGRFNTEVEIDTVRDLCDRTARRLRGMLPSFPRW